MSDKEEDFMLSDVGKRMGSVSDLPKELRDQLSSSYVDELEERILVVLGQYYGGIANLDEILVGLYRAFDEVYERKFVNGKLYRMSKRGMVESVPQRKGIYRILR